MAKYLKFWIMKVADFFCISQNAWIKNQNSEHIALLIFSNFTSATSTSIIIRVYY